MNLLDIWEQLRVQKEPWIVATCFMSIVLILLGTMHKTDAQADEVFKLEVGLGLVAVTAGVLLFIFVISRLMHRIAELAKDNKTIKQQLDDALSEQQRIVKLPASQSKAFSESFIEYTKLLSDLRSCAIEIANKEQIGTDDIGAFDQKNNQVAKHFDALWIIMSEDCHKASDEIARECMSFLSILRKSVELAYMSPLRDAAQSLRDKIESNRSILQNWYGDLLLQKLGDRSA